MARDSISAGRLHHRPHGGEGPNSVTLSDIR